MAGPHLRRQFGQKHQPALRDADLDQPPVFRRALTGDQAPIVQPVEQAGNVRGAGDKLSGCGAHSEAVHAASLAHYVSQHPGEVELVAACDLRRERAERFCCDYGFADAYTDVETMLAIAGPDAVVCIMPVEKIAEVSGL